MPSTTAELKKILSAHKVDSFITMTLGSSIGSLMDRGLSDDEILGLCRELLYHCRHAKQDPAILSSVEKLFEQLRT